LQNGEARVVQEMAVFTGNAHPKFAEDICKHLEIPLGECEVFEFSNENPWNWLEELHQSYGHNE